MYYLVVKVDFYSDIKTYLGELSDSPIRSVEDMIQYNLDAVGSEGGVPGIHPGFMGGQENFHASAATKGVKDETYRSALVFTHSSSRRGIDSALHNRGEPVDALLVPAGFAQAISVAAQARYPLVTVPAGVNTTRTDIPFGLMLMGTEWSEGELIKWASAIEDAITAAKGSRPLPNWKDHQRRVLPVLYE